MTTLSEMSSPPTLPVWGARFARLVQESFDFLGSQSDRKNEHLVVRAIPRSDGEHRVVYRYGVLGELLPLDVIEDFRDILARARSVLDIAMFDAVTRQASPPLTARQERSTYFPIAATEADWKSLAGQPHMKALTVKQLTKLENIQPFVTGSATLSEFAKVHNDDKHQAPVRLAVVPDVEFVMLFNHLFPPPASAGEYWVDWVTPLAPVENGKDFVEYKSTEVIVRAAVEDVPVALAVEVPTGWRDVQHFLWEVLEFTSRATAVLHDGDMKLADALRDYFAFRRDELAAFRRMLVEHDAASEAQWLTSRGGSAVPHGADGIHLHPVATRPGVPVHSLPASVDWRTLLCVADFPPSFAKLVPWLQLK
jgi:hypothetical protein